jgi:hypothetical protein
MIVRFSLFALALFILVIGQSDIGRRTPTVLTESTRDHSHAPDITPAPLRQARARAFNSGPGAKALADGPEGLHPVIHIEYGRLEPLPFNKNGTVALGTVAAKQAYLSEDGSMVYTEYSFTVQDILFNRAAYVPSGSSIAVVMHGGAIVANKRTLATIARPQVSLEEGKRYVLFLREIHNTGAYLLDKPWPIDKGYVGIARTDAEDYTFTGMDEKRFIDRVRQEGLALLQKRPEKPVK